MQYQNIYDALIKRGQNRNLDTYTERHHIVPRCLGGSDSPDNLVNLTPEEHYVAHQLLTKIHPTHYGLANAALKMCQGRPNNKLYGWIRKRFAANRSAKMAGNGNSMYNKRWIANNTETLLVDEPTALKMINSGNYIAGKKAKIAACGHLVASRCIVCENAKRKAYDLKKETARLLALQLFDEFKKSGLESVTKFAAANNTSQPRLSALWKRYVPEYRDNRQHGKRFKKE